MRFDILTIFPDLIYHYVEGSILARAQKSGQIQIKAHDFRAFTLDKHQRVDDKPYGGGPGMILQVEPIYRCLENLGLVKEGKKVKNKKTKIIILDPDGKKFDQKMAKHFSKLDNLIIISGRYEGFDERVYKYVDERVSVGDYVLAGGELPALIITEATARLSPGVLGNKESLWEETFNRVTYSTKHVTANTKNRYKLQVTGYVEYPQYTRPENFMGAKVPPVLLSGNHKKIEEWRTAKIKKLKIKN